MAKNLSMPKGLAEKLVKHLVEIEEDKSKFAEDYVYRSPRERDKLMRFFEHYLSELEKFVQTGDLSESHGDVPFVIIGSQVMVEDMDSCESFNLTIKNPLRDNIGYDDVSCLSPVGKALLLKKNGDKVSISTPGGVINYRIKEIKLHFI